MKKIAKKWKLIGGIVLVLLFIWFLIVSPYLTFSKNEKSLEEAAKRYFELNPNELPTGERFKTLSLETLYRKSYLKEDLYIPYTNKTCSIKNSWVKVRKENGVYQYYTYLKCGILQSRIDHTGPEIELNGETKIQIGLGEEFTDPGVKSVKDKVDGKIDISKVNVKSDVDTSKVGTYEITYTAYDSLNNKTIVTRTITVVQTLYSTIKEELKDVANYKGDPENNYLRLSNMLYRVYGIDEDNNILIVSDEDVAYINYTKIDKWLDYYYEHLNDMTKGMIVEKKYCKDALSESELTTTTACSSYTENKKVYIPSVELVNSVGENGTNFMKPYTISWLANGNSGNDEAYTTREIFFGDDYDKEYVSFDTLTNLGIRPMMTIKGDSLIEGGDGTSSNPYVFGDVKKAKGGSLVNERYTGEYLSIDGSIYRIIEVDEDGTTKVISNFTVGNGSDEALCFANPDSDIIVYDPKDKSSVAYFINNRANAYVDTSYFVNHNVKVPIYKDHIIYGEEVETKDIKVKLSAPNMYEMFSAVPRTGLLTHWLINSSKAERTTGLINNVIPSENEIPNYKSAYARIVGFIKKDATINSGNGTIDSPYIIK